ncbi:MAG: transcriptional activator FtrB [Planctomycetaceae bacterium]|nr:transcriptional activator FtrB [Planctomycetaceae bacterium]
MSSTDPSLAEELCNLQFASGWSDGVVTELAAISKYVEFAAGTIIFTQGAENHDLFLLSAGRVGLDMYVPARGAVRILTLSRGELLAWSALVGDGHMTATATALEPVRAIAIDGARLLDLCDRRHDIGYRVMKRLAWALSHRLVATRLQLLDLYSHTTPHVLQSPVERR